MKSTKFLIELAKKIPIALLCVVLACEYGVLPNPAAPSSVDLKNAFYCELNLENRSDNTFKVRMFVDELSDVNKIFQFSATAPGTYRILNIGRFVKKFSTFDANYTELDVTKLSTNQWQLSDPTKTRIIEFEISATDLSSATTGIALSQGSSISNDCVVINPSAVFGYIEGLQERDFYLKIDYPQSWNVATSLEKNSQGYYFAPSYAHLADNPVMMGNLTVASETVDGTEFNVFCYSKYGLVSATEILRKVQPIYQDANKFLKGLPVKRYNYLYHFDARQNKPGGGMEHASSSIFAINEPFPELAGLRTTSAHEFFHTITPLSLHNEIIENFNFAIPTPSEHLWWYEGATCWASIMMQYRNSSCDINTMLSYFAGRLYYPRTVSLSATALGCYDNDLSLWYAYSKGTLSMTLLDIRLLELSHGTKGLRELILELFHEYHDKPFEDKSFFSILTARSYPEIGDFLNHYVRGSDDLPLREYFDKVGIIFDARSYYYPLKLNPNPTMEQQALFKKWSVNL